ncbi:MAG: hypothetical protein KGL35_27040 [Bradyrhizobium sp.]|nr:hypothetical protein [Bradyrhizobium sp.]
MPGGEYPIETKADLHNAVRAFGRASDKPAVRRHIVGRARALGAVDDLPKDWNVSKRGMIVTILEKIGLKKQAQDFEAAQASQETGEYAQGMLAEFSEALDALQASICSIMSDDAVPDKESAVKDTIAQFQQHIQGVVPEGVENAMRGAALAAAGYTINDQGAISKGDHAMTDEEKKALEAADKARKDDHEDTKKALIVAKREIAILKMSDKHAKFMADAGMTADEKDKFADMEPAERDAHMEQNPVEKRLPESVRKALVEAEDLKKRLAALESGAAAVSFQKMAADAGLGDAHAATLQKAYAGERDGVDALVALVKAANAQAREAGIFKEFGATGDGTASNSAHDQILAKAAELRKQNPALTEAQAYAKAYQDPANREIAKRERASNRPAA